ncbi:MAG: hypothetical protein KA715_10445 [Xanthomonadaceae bacterium]|nr:hypothetical protein [Xanthomonadaceae bacterium]
MSFWIITSWVLVAILTAVNIFVFLKLKKASEQMMKMTFPGSKDMGQAMQQMQAMMGGKSPQQMQAQMKQAMNMLNQMQNKRR